MPKEIKSTPYYSTQEIIDLPKKHLSEPITFKNMENSYKEKCHVIKEKLEQVEKYSREIQNTLRADKREKKYKQTLNRQQLEENSQLNEVNLKKHYNYYMIERYDALNKMKMKTSDRGDSDDSSWMDLSEASTANIAEWGSGDKQLLEQKYLEAHMFRLRDFYELKISNLLNIIEEIKQENLFLKQDIDDRDKELQNSEELFCSSPLHSRTRGYQNFQ